MIPQSQRVLSGRGLWQRDTKRLVSTIRTEGPGDMELGGCLTLLIAGSVELIVSTV